MVEGVYIVVGIYGWGVCVVGSMHGWGWGYEWLGACEAGGVHG